MPNRERFRASKQLGRPHVMLGFNVFTADTDEQARFLATSMQQAFVDLRSGRPSTLQPPVRDDEGGLSGGERRSMIFDHEARLHSHEIAAQVSPPSSGHSSPS